MRPIDEPPVRVDPGRPGYRPAQIRRARGDVAEASVDWVAHHPYATTHGKTARWVARPNEHASDSLLRLRALQASQAEHAAANGVPHPVAPPQRSSGGSSFLGGLVHEVAHGASRGLHEVAHGVGAGVHAVGHAAGEVERHVVSPVYRHALRPFGQGVAEILGPNSPGWHTSPLLADLGNKTQQQRVAEYGPMYQNMARGVLEGLAPQTVMALAHGHAPTRGDVLWDATLFGGPTVKLLRAARGATVGVDAIRAVREARLAGRAAAGARRAANVYQHPTEAWLDALEARRAVRKTSDVYRP